MYFDHARQLEKEMPDVAADGPSPGLSQPEIDALLAPYVQQAKRRRSLLEALGDRIAAFGQRVRQMGATSKE